VESGTGNERIESMCMGPLSPPGARDGAEVTGIVEVHDPARRNWY